ncbi:regulator of chromosome condensation 1/beta-lactamase-inhibitor protein II [Ilyonectria robusta]|uniref:regulator of chromosome condensation 1/beta-lactamase-inhibitor protein II n=1 Tax=Ilyonectria robusta TaxID=1079257 RepID=UPI001E8E8583|nr:regulator of chromosome condensation 1/beta-lactamase-inhibitor protein II [Ilyonectria robusta]KAH8676909.1 regulator of chromosome condensation 1/beta-lactamase-inhibitor protein II [Ilyonectria robusta]
MAPTTRSARRRTAGSSNGPGGPATNTKTQTPATVFSVAIRKRKDPGNEKHQATKKQKTQTTHAVAKAKPKRAAAPRVSAISAPSPIVDQSQPKFSILMLGTVDFSELGLGPDEKECMLPRLNPYLDPNEQSAFHISKYAVGGMHTVAVTVDNKVVTWGVNDHGALGRDTSWDGDETANRHESTPCEVSPLHFPPGARIIQVAASDSCSLALTDTGLVYGWGTFLDPGGKKRFGYDQFGKLITIQNTPRLILGLSNITQIACGANHALALDAAGTIWAWGSGHQNQLGKRLVGRYQDGLTPRRVEIFRNKAKYIASGAYHSFAVDQKDNVWAWGLNGLGQAGDVTSAGGYEAFLPHPMKIPGLSGRGVHVLDGGTHHSAAVTEDGECLMWGSIRGGQLGIRFTQEQIQDSSHVLCDERGEPRICLRPTAVPGIGPVAHVACSTGHTIYITKSGNGYGTGFGNGGQLGNGNEDDADVPQLMIGDELHGKHLVSAGAGGQFSVVAARAKMPGDY